MPGLVILLAPKPNNTFAPYLTQMAKVMHHENFYKEDIFLAEFTSFVAARVHLNVVNKEPQPIYNEDSTMLIMMDGELYNRDELRETLVSRGHDIKTNSDAELLLHLYEDMGEDFAHELNGWFLALIHDKEQKKSVIVNDYFGIYRVFYSQVNNTLIMASEIKSILKHKQLSKSPKSPNVQKFAEYFLYGGVLNDETLFKDIYRLPPASLWTYKDGHVSKKQYSDFTSIQPNTSISQMEVFEEAARLFEKIIPRYASGDGIGLSLTGGWDTRTELALIKRLGYSMPCYTWCGPYGDSLDVKVARKAAKAVGMEHHVIKIEKDFFEEFSDYAFKVIYVSDGSADIFQSHEIYLNNLSRALVPIRLTGKYGSQTMSGGFLVPKCKFYRGMFSEQFLHDIGQIGQYIRPFEDWQSTIETIRWLWPEGFMAVESSQIVLRIPYMDKDLAKFLLSVPKSYLQRSVIQKHIIKNNCKQLTRIPSNKGAYIKSKNGLGDIKISMLAGLYNILTKLDKAYLHGNVPHVFVRLDPLMKYTGLEKIFLGACNLASYRRWVKDQLRDFTEKMLLEERTLSRTYLNPDFIRKMVSDHFNNKANYIREIGRIISLEIWHRLFVD